MSKIIEDTTLCPAEDCGREFTENFDPFNKTYQGNCNTCGHTVDLHLSDIEGATGLSNADLELAFGFIARHNLIKDKSQI